MTLVIEAFGGVVYRIKPNGDRAPIQRRDKDGYLNVVISGKKRGVHRVVWEHVNGSIPDNMQIDHIDGVRHNNSIFNLRVVTGSENQQNRHRISSNNTSGIRGVSWIRSRGRWVAQLYVGGKHLHLGYFINMDDAIAAYRHGAAIHHTHNPDAEKTPPRRGNDGVQPVNLETTATDPRII